ncbi:hypothetical protein GWO43_18265, partial [candidate division KSB1 bacterium]|nr:hypothetical protein [candidate division KSB1 bacterium]NIX72460.1 hypothetical protein [candidate division KSB1 bacterium]
MPSSLDVRSFILATFCFCCLFTSSIWSRTYYVDVSNGNDSNSGTSEASPWKSISKVNGTDFQPGDVILFKRGERWHEQLVIKSDGVSGSPITFGAYGSGAKPVITAADFVTDWIRVSGQSNVWKTRTSTQTRIVIFDGNLGIEAGSKNRLNEEFEWNWEAGELFIFSPGDPNQVYSNPGIEVGQRDNAILGHDRNYTTIDGLELRGANGKKNYGAGILLAGDHVTIKNCTFNFNFYAGIHAADAADNGTVSNCKVHHNQDNGIALGRGSGWKIEDCQVYANGYGPRVRSGILFDTSNTIVSRCTVYDNGNGSTELGLTHGIYVNPTAVNVTIEECVIYDHRNGNGINYDADSGEIRRNYVYDNYFSGIHLENQQKGGWVNIYNNIVHGNNCGITLYYWQWNEDTRVRIYNNTLYENNRYLNLPGKVEQEPYELCILTNVKKLRIWNNIFYNSSEYFTIYCVEQRDMVSDYNCIYKTAGPKNGTYCYYEGKRTFAGWKAASGGDANSI